MKILQVFGGYEALVDNDVYEWASKHKWHIHEAGRLYPKTKINGKPCRLSRLITNAPEGMDVDHINGDVLDNRRENLRVVTHSENCLNRRKITGVTYEPSNRQWRARVTVGEYKRKHLGRFETREEAEEAVRNFKKGSLTDYEVKQ